jgi:hypothetical protein
MNEPKQVIRFEQISERIRLDGYHRVRLWVDLSPTDSIGGFLSKLWQLFGPPNVIDFEGYTYQIQDHQTGAIFLAYCAGSGPAFSGNSDTDPSLMKSLDDFEALLEKTPHADCEIEFETDFGVYRTGSRDGVPFGKTFPYEK